MKTKTNNKLWHDLKVVALVSVFLGIVMGFFVIFNIYGHNQTNLQGYLINTQDTGQNFELLYEHLVVFEPSSDNLVLSFYVDDGDDSTDLIDQEVGGIGLEFTNLPDYLEFDSYVVRPEMTGWTELYAFENGVDKIDLMSGSDFLMEGKFIDISFSIDSNSITSSFVNVGVKANFVNAAVVPTEEGTFVLAPKSSIVLDAPINIYPTSTIDIPFDLSWASGIDPTQYPVEGVTLKFENIPDFMSYDNLVNGPNIPGWMVIPNFASDIPTIAGSKFRASANITPGELFTLKMEIPDLSAVDLTVPPIKVNVQFASNGIAYYSMPIMMNIVSIPVPQNLVATADDLDVTLTWTDLAAADQYEVWNITDNVSVDDAITANTYSYTVPASKYGTTIQYKVRSKIGDGWSDWSNPASVQIVQATVPIPQNVVATAAGPTGRVVTVRWDAVVGADRYDVYQGTTLVASPTGTTATITVTVPYGTTLTYKVKAKIGTAYSDWSNPASVQIVQIVPQNVNAAATGATGRDVTVTWDPVVGADSYEVYEGTTKIATPTGAIYTNTVTVPYGTTLTYKVKAKIGNLLSDFSDPASVDIVAVTVPAPDNVLATVSGTTGRLVTVTWDAVTNADGYKVYEGTTLVASPTGTTYTITTTVPYGTTLTYKVKAQMGTLLSAFSVPSSVTIEDPNPVLPAPQGLTASVDDRTVTLDWSAVSGATTYEIYADGASLITVTPLTYTYTVGEGEYGSTITYKVRAIQSDTLTSNFSNEASVYIEEPYTPPSINPADICRYDQSGLQVEPGGDYITDVLDLNCLVAEWKDTGTALIADIYNITPSNEIVDIRDLTQLLGAWSDDPVISTILPASGSTGTEVTISGNTFYGNLPASYVEVYLINKTNPSSVFPTNITQISDTEIKFIVPATAVAGEYNVRVVISKSLYTSAPSFTVL